MPAPPSLLGRTLGGYVLQKQIGAGGMGVVFRAHDDRIDRTVAIKVIPARFLKDETLRQRFLREGRTAARIDHPNVVRILSAGEEDGIPFLVMEHVDGGSLQSVIEKRRQLPIRTAVRIVREIAEGLAAAHRVGVMHRDVKPANVLFTKDGNPKLVDFGLAREEITDVSLSQTGMVMGTPHYMAPEVCAGKRGDARSDVYSLGVLAYVLIALRLPFDGEGAIQVLMKHVSEPPPPLTEAPRAVASVIDRALAKDPGKRWQSAGEFADALAAVEGAEGGSVHAGGHSPGGRIPAPAPSAVSHSVVGETAAPSRLRENLPVSPGAAPEPGAETPTAGVSPVRGRRSWALPAAGAAAALAATIGLGVWALRVPSPENPGLPGPAGPVVPIPESEPPAGEVSADTEWEAELERLARESGVFESRGRFAKALELWKQASPPHARGRAAVARAALELEGRARAWAEEAIKDAPRGAKGAALLREDAKNLPVELAGRMEEAARAFESDWRPEDGLEEFRKSVTRMNLDGCPERLTRLSAGAAGEHLAAIEVAGTMLQRALATRGRACEWFGAHIGSDLSLALDDGSRITGVLAGFLEDPRELVLSVEDREVRVPVDALSIGDWISRSTAGVAAEEDLLAAFDTAAILGTPPELWQVAHRLRRRRIGIDDAREKILERSIPQDLGEQARADYRRLTDAAGGGEEAGAAAAEFLRKFHDLPYFGQSAQAKAVLAEARTPATAELLTLAMSGQVLATGDVTSLAYGPGDELLGDVGILGGWSVEPGEALRVVPGPRGAVLRLASLEYGDVRFHVRLEPQGAFGVLLGTRSEWEYIGVSCRPVGGNNLELRLPLLGESVKARGSRDGIIDLRAELKGTTLSVELNGQPGTCELPETWEGGLALYLASPTTIHALEITGNAAFGESDQDKVMAPLEEARKRHGKSNPIRIGKWQDRGTDTERVEVAAWEKEVRLAPGEWSWGDHWTARWTALLDDNVVLLLDLQPDTAAPVILMISPDSSPVLRVSGQRAFITGQVAPVSRQREHTFELSVSSSLGSLSVEGQVVWSGRLQPEGTGGFRMRLKDGKASLRGLSIAPLKPSRK